MAAARKTAGRAASFTPPGPVRNAARTGLTLRASVAPSRRGGTAVGLARARDLANGRPVSVATLKRMVSYFARHSVDIGKPGWHDDHPRFPSKGVQAWLLWGGDAGHAWALRKLKSKDGRVRRNPVGALGGGTQTYALGRTTIIYSTAPDGHVEVQSVRTPATARGQGSARAAMLALLAETDAAGLAVTLCASPLDKRTHLGKLVAFYQSLGFTLTGRACNMAGDPMMVRRPR